MTEEQFPPKMSLPVAIGALKELNEWLKIYYRVQAMDGIAALDVVIAEVEKDVIMKDKLIMILRKLFDHKITIIEAFNRIIVKEVTE